MIIKRSKLSYTCKVDNNQNNLKWTIFTQLDNILYDFVRQLIKVKRLI